MDQSRQKRRRKKLQEHHNVCNDGYEKAQAMKLAQEREETLLLHRRLNETKHHKEGSGDSNTTVTKTTILDHHDAADSTGVPELMRTESVILTKRMLMGDDTAAEVSSSDISEDEYVPKSNDSDSDTSSEDQKVATKSRIFAHKKRRCSTSLNSDEEPSTSGDSDVKVRSAKSRKLEAPETCSTSQDTEVDQTQESGPEVKVMTLLKKEDGSRMYSKLFYCVFCFKPYKRMSRHLEAMHKNEPQVAGAIASPPKSKERRVQLDLLRNRGNRVHNNQVLREGTGTVIPRQQSKRPVKSTDYMHCVNCQGYFKRKSLWRHMQRCQLNLKVKNLKPGKTRVQTLCAYAQPVPENVSEQFWKLALAMNEDDITAAVRKEKVILLYGEHLFNKHGHDVTSHEYIRQKMRETGRLLLQGKKNGKLKEMMDFFIPANFPHVVEAVKNVAGFDVKTSTYKTPSLALKSGQNLKKIASIVECEGRISGDDNIIQNVQAFKKIGDIKWNECVSSQALRNLSETKWNVPQLLPFTEDVKTMHQYLNAQRQEYQKKLKEDPNMRHWGELAKVTLSEIIVFNRRRAGEVSKMPLNAFALKETSSSHPDVELALSNLEQKLCKHFQRIEIRGKRGRKVPILLTPDMQASMELLVNTRRDCGVPDENIFFFGKPQALSFFRGPDVIRQIARSCGAKNPKALLSTKLRKHVATMSKVLNLKDNEMDDLADFLGHDIRVHRQYYRLPEGTLQLAKVSKVLLAMEQGKMSKFKGKNLDQINIDPQEEITLNTDESESEDEGDNKSVTSPKASTSSDKSSAKDIGTKMNSLPAQDKSSAKDIGRKMNSPPAQEEGPKENERRKWTPEEVEAVEKTLKDCIRTLKVPGKAQCEKCIKTSPLALKDRTWKAVKFYVKNRIDTLNRKTKAK